METIDQNDAKAKISQMLPSPENCKLGIGIARQLELTGLEMHVCIAQSTLTLSQQVYLEGYLLKHNGMLGGSKIDLEWKPKPEIDLHDDAQWYNEREYLKRMGAWYD